MRITVGIFLRYPIGHHGVVRMIPWEFSSTFGGWPLGFMERVAKPAA
jgi:hypothetical protein